MSNTNVNPNSDEQNLNKKYTCEDRFSSEESIKNYKIIVYKHDTTCVGHYCIHESEQECDCLSKLQSFFSKT